MTLYFVTGNKNKLREMRKIIPDAEQLSADLPEIQSLDLKEIVREKLHSARKLSDGDVIVEDVSFHMEALDGMPGPLIKWFLKAMGREGLFELAKATGKYGAEAKAVVGLSTEEGVQFFEGSVKGTIVPPSGTSEFGWDPIFKPDGAEKTFAELSTDEKNKISHRGKALAKLKAYLESQTPKEA